MKEHSGQTPGEPRGDTPKARTALARLDEQERAEYWAVLALRHCKGIGIRSIYRLLRHFGSAYEAVHNVADWSAAKVPPAKGEPLQQDAWRQAARPVWEDSRDLAGHIILWTNPLYPTLLREIPDAPPLLYARGNTGLLKSTCVALVGSRAASANRKKATYQLARELSNSGITVVSGLARGIDRAAHEGALGGVGSSIAVLGAGIDVIYPPDNADLHRKMAEHGLILSEFPPGTNPDSRHFPIRNRIISGLSHGVVIMEAGYRSGSLVTARLALEQNRSVFAYSPEPVCPSNPLGSIAPIDPKNEASPISTPQGTSQATSVGQKPGAEADIIHNATGDAASATIEATTGTTDKAEDACLGLLEQGALPCLTAQDILEDLLPQLAAHGQEEQESHCHHNNQALLPFLVTQSAVKAEKKKKNLSVPSGSTGLTDPHGSIQKAKSAELKAQSSARHAQEKEHTASCLPPLPANSVEERIVHILEKHGPQLLDDLATLAQEENTGLLNATLVILEVQGYVRRMPGARFEVC